MRTEERDLRIYLSTAPFPEDGKWILLDVRREEKNIERYLFSIVIVRRNAERIKS
jgi:hypothetical protein